MTAGRAAPAVIEHVMARYPSLEMEAVTAFLQLCAEDGLSMHALAKRLGIGQSSVRRNVTALMDVGGAGEHTGLVVVRARGEDSLRQTVHLSLAGRALKRSVFES